MGKKVDLEEVFQFMEDFGIPIVTSKKELILDEESNTFADITGCADMWDVRTRVVFALCRPVAKGLDEKSSTRLLNQMNRYFQTELTKRDMLVMYRELCYANKFNEFKGFVKRGFPMGELQKSEVN